MVSEKTLQHIAEIARGLEIIEHYRTLRGESIEATRRTQAMLVTIANELRDFNHQEGQSWHQR